MTYAALPLRADLHTWALVLAGGGGQRLRALTTLADGTAIPKQYCSLWDGPTLFQESLGRARSVTVRRHICAIVAAAHRHWWEVPMWQLPAHNTIVQPADRGTGIGVLLPLLHILHRDRSAQIVLLPSDHHVRDEAALAQTLRGAVAHAAAHDTVTLVGIQPEHASTQLGYIVPGKADGNGGFRVMDFVEKPAADLAGELIRRGALWNSFLIAAPAHALLQLYQPRHSAIVARLRDAVAQDADTPADGFATADVYEGLPTLDFSRDILRGQTQRLHVLAAPPCGWSDLGTPSAVAEAVQRGGGPQRSSRGPWALSTLCLSSRYLQQQPAPADRGEQPLSPSPPPPPDPTP